MRKISLFAALLCLASLYAEDKNMEKQRNFVEQNPLKKPIQVYQAYDNDGVNLGLRADVLYMIYNSSILTYAADQVVTNQVLNSHILNVPGKMSFGCNVAVSYTLPVDPGYTFESSWYHIVAEFGRRYFSPHITPAHTVALTSSSPGSASVTAQAAINFFDFLAMKKFGFGDWVTMTPAAGLVGGYINTQNRTFFSANGGNFGSSTTSASLIQTIKFEGIGLKLGGKSSLQIWEGFKLKSEIFYNILYGRTSALLTYNSNGSYSAASLKGAVSEYSQNHGRSFFDCLLGLAWEGTFNKDSLYLEMHAGWRFQSFENGWIEYEAEFNDALHDLTLYGQGLQAGATFKF